MSFRKVKVLNIGFKRPARAAAIFFPAVMLPEAVWAVEPAIHGATLDPMSGASLLQMFAGLLAVLALVFLMAWVMRRFGRGALAGGSGLRVLGALSVGARERVILIQAGETQLLVGVAPGRVQSLLTLDKPIAIEPGRTAGGPGFAERLRQAMSSRDAK